MLVHAPVGWGGVAMVRVPRILPVFGQIRKRRVADWASVRVHGHWPRPIGVLWRRQGLAPRTFHAWNVQSISIHICPVSALCIPWDI